MARNSVCKKIRPTQKNYLNEYLKVRTGLGLIEKNKYCVCAFRGIDLAEIRIHNRAIFARLIVQICSGFAGKNTCFALTKISINLVLK